MSRLGKSMVTENRLLVCRARSSRGIKIGMQLLAPNSEKLQATQLLLKHL